MKKILCLFAGLLLFISASFASGEKEFLNIIRKNAADFEIKQSQYYKNSLDNAEGAKEVAFLKLYLDYFDYFKKNTQYYHAHPQLDINYEFAINNREECKKYGVGFNVSEGSWYITEDYNMLMNTKGIPQTWFEWLSLQQKYSLKHEEVCEKAFRKGRMCEGGTMTYKEMEQAIVDLENVEKQSDVISSIRTKDYSYIPYTSFNLLCDYLLGNDLRPVYDRDENWQYSKLKKEVQKSYSHFAKNHKNSRYWFIINGYYTKLKNNNFESSDDISLWVFDELQKIQNF